MSASKQVGAASAWQRLPIATSWWRSRRLGGGAVRLDEPHVHELLAANVFVVSGRDRTVVVDAGMGLSPLRPELDPSDDRPVTLLVTHTHSDHVGAAHEFEDRRVHGFESELLTAPPPSLLRGSDLSAEEWVMLEQTFDVAYAEWFVDRRPSPDFDPDAYAITPAPATELLAEGDVVDLGDRRLTVLHLPGHSPGGLGFYDEHHGVLFSGDAVYDGPLLDELPGSDIGAYLSTMRRLRDLPVSVVHTGHGESFGEHRLVELADAYLHWRG